MSLNLIPRQAADSASIALVLKPLRKDFVPGPLQARQTQAANPESWLNFHSDFNLLLAEMLGRFANCRSNQLSNELDSAFQRICEFLEIDRAGIWQLSSTDHAAFILTTLYPARALQCGQRQDSNNFGSSSIDEHARDAGATPSLHRSSLLLAKDDVGRGRGKGARSCDLLQLKIGAKARDLFPWISAEVECGQVVVFSNLEQLPAEAARDREILSALGFRSAAIVPFLISGKVAGALSFAASRHETIWPRELIERLSLLAQLFANVIARSNRDNEILMAVSEITGFKAELTKSNAELKELKDRMEAESEVLEAELNTTHDPDQIIGRSKAVRRVLQRVEQVAATDCSVLIGGETGTGKELIAQEIHRLSRHKERGMVLVNCAALPTELAESELFGRERGAYTGAQASQAGRFEIANGSTIFLDEVGELSIEVQAKLLRVLQQGEFQRLGSSKTCKVDVRVLAATNRDLAGEVRKGRFREDLYYRLRVFPIELPPLRERVEDIPLLVFAFLREFSAQLGRKISKISRQGMEQLQKHRWPGNIRELRNVIERSVILTSGDTLNLSFLGNSPSSNDHPVTLAQAEREHILKALESTDWRIKGPEGAARRLDVQPTILLSSMQRLGIPHRVQ